MTYIKKTVAALNFLRVHCFCLTWQLINICRCKDLMLVPISPALEFGIILNGILRKEPPIQTPFITWILMLQHANMLISYLMTKYSLCDCLLNFYKANLHSTPPSFSTSCVHLIFNLLCNC